MPDFQTEEIPETMLVRDLTVGQLRELLQSAKPRTAPLFGERTSRDERTKRPPGDKDPYMFYDQPSGGFCPTSAHTVAIHGNRYKTAEHAYLAEQFDEPDIQAAIATAWSCHEARAVYQQRRSRMKPMTVDARCHLMYSIMTAKMEQHPELLEFLCRTAPRPLVFNSYNDTLWGCGRDETGHNHLGRILMQIREELGGRI